MIKICFISFLLLFLACDKSGKAGTSTDNNSSKISTEKVSLPSWADYVENASLASLENLAEGSSQAQEAQKRVISANNPLEIKLKKSGISFRIIPAGTFTMGSKKGKYLETYVHKVILTQNFYCGKFEITQGQWIKVMGSLPDPYTSGNRQKGSKLPVVEVSWDDCQQFLRKLENLEGLPSNSLDLLTEAQWEYSCRAGTSTDFYFGDVVTSDKINFNGEKPDGDSPKSMNRKKTLEVGSLQSNAFGLFDMHGNVSEWCADFCLPTRAAAQTYEDGIKDPISKVGEFRVKRGGGYASWQKSTTSYKRTGLSIDSRSADTGFRIQFPVRLFTDK